MAFTFKVKASEAPLTAGVYPGYLVDIEEFDSVHGPSLKWYFIAVSGEGEKQVTAVTSQKVSASSKAFQFAEAILQRPLRPHEEFTPAKLYSEICDLTVTVATLDNGNTVNRIAQVLPHKKAKPAIPVTPADGEPMDDDDVPF